MSSRLWVIVGAIVFVVAVESGAEIPQVISYQGKVTDSGGTAVPDGNYQMRFRIMDAPTGANILWGSGTRTIAVNDGVFNVLLGESPQPALNLEFDQDYWLLVTFEGVNQTPRPRIASTGYAYMASGLVAGTEVIGSVSTGDNSALKVTNTAPTGFTYGVYGVSSSTQGRGVCGHATATSGLVYGVFGRCESTLGHGVYGNASASSGDTNGVYGVSFSSTGNGVHGIAAATIGATYGGHFESVAPSGRGVYGLATATTGVNYGVHGRSNSPDGTGVYGHALATTGVTLGVKGESWSTSGEGVYGHALATTGVNLGVVGSTYSPSGYGVYYSGGLGGSGTKSCVVKTSQGPTLLYCQESPECWFEDVGGGQLVDGRAHVELDPLFRETVTINAQNPMRVFVQLHDENSEGVAVKKGTTGFDVVEFRGGRSNSTFDYRVMAKRKGFEDKRLDYCAAAETDSYLYPELREKELRELAEERARIGEKRSRMEEERARLHRDSAGKQAG